MRHVLRIQLFAIAAFIMLTMTSCAAIPTGTPEDAAAVCIQSVTTARKAATALLRAGKITIEKDQAIQSSLDAAVPGCAEMAIQGVSP